MKIENFYDGNIKRFFKINKIGKKSFQQVLRELLKTSKKKKFFLKINSKY